MELIIDLMQHITMCIYNMYTCTSEEHRKNQYERSKELIERYKYECEKYWKSKSENNNKNNA